MNKNLIYGENISKYFTKFKGDDKMYPLGVNCMLLQYRVKNYSSIKNEVYLNMLATSNREHNSFIREIGNGVKVLPIAAVYGANASGKSNLLRSFAMMRYNVILSMFSEKKLSFRIPFLYDENRIENTEYEVVFAKNDIEYQYGMEVNDYEVIEEWLYERKLSKNKTKSKLIFYRNVESINYDKKYEKLNNYNEFIKNNNFVISFFGEKEIEYVQAFKDVYDFFQDALYTIVPTVGKIENNNYILEYYYNDKKCFENCKKFLKEFDPSIQDINILYDEAEKKYSVIIKRLNEWLPISFESDGTKKMFYLFINVYRVLNNGGVLVADELDCQLHPLLFRKIVRQFNGPENSKNAQIIFTSHNLIVLDNKELRRDEIWFTEKNNATTSLMSLAEFKIDKASIRADLDYGKHYLAGRFGGIPYIGDE
mgnify:CR=1 FL=1